MLDMHFLLLPLVVISRHLPFTAIFSASTTRGSPLLGDSYAIGVAFKVLMSLIAWIMVALFVALVACPPPFSVSSIGYWFLSGGCGLVLIMLFGYEWCVCRIPLWSSLCCNRLLPSI
ncbi:hypothetical protein Pyn_33300 [Prunus yedoensis var. nudiflora]|uniref:Uncharacterized protein n=1 Tax=Prunus yedoensis var. nudiflora TaxID=2094558 RepID=A0A314YZ10_PRUYE|nr:hypothetical protein Pyn_33300 [Prunus yedoensis var. nudiflora]